MIKILLDRTTNNYKYRSDWDNLAIGEYFIKQRDKELIFCKKVNNYQTENIGYITDLKEFLYTYEDKFILPKKGTDFMINIKTFESNGIAYGSGFDNALRRASEQLEEFINKFLEENNINNSNILSLDIKHDIVSDNDDYEYCFMTAVLCYMCYK